MPLSFTRRPTFVLLLAAASAALALISALALSSDVPLVLVLTLFFSGVGTGATITRAVALLREARRPSSAAGSPSEALQSARVLRGTAGRASG